MFSQLRSGDKILLVFLLLFSLLGISQKKKNLIPNSVSEYAVGVKRFQLEDPVRKDLLNPDESHHLPVTVYYPTVEKSSVQRNYIEDQRVLSTMIDEHYSYLEDSTLIKMAKVKVNSTLNAAIIPDEKFPLLLFSHGLGMSTIHYTLLLEKLAAKGFIVVAADHPYGGFTLFSNGKLSTSRQNPAMAEGKKEDLLQMIDSWSADHRFILENLFRRTTDIGAVFSRQINWTSIAVIGHSLGGNAAINTCLKNHKIKIAINLDGGTFNEEKEIKPLDKTVLTLRSQPDYTDEELVQKGRNPAEWKTMGIEIDRTFLHDMAKVKTAYEIKITGAGHLSFSDAPFVSPQMVSKFGGKIIDAEKGFALITSAILGFLQTEFTGAKFNLTDLIIDFPEVSIKGFNQ